MRNKGIKRLAFFVVFLIPVAWYLFLQLFGSNNFSLDIIGDIPTDCKSFEAITIVAKGDSLSIVEINYMNRVIFAANKRGSNLVYESADFFSCIGQDDSELILVSKEGLWGTYELSREGVDQLLTELDILSLQKTYGKGTSR